MDLAAKFLLVCTMALQVASIYLLTRKTGGLTRRENRGLELARMSVRYAEQLGGTGGEKLMHALGCFRQLDMADGKRDYSETEMRLYIERAANEL